MATRQEVSRSILSAFAQVKSLVPEVELVMEDNCVSFKFPYSGGAGNELMLAADVVVLAQGGAQPDSDFAETICEALDEAGVDYSTWS